MIKKLLGLLIFVGLSLFGFSNAWVYVQEIGLNNGFSNYASNYINVNENINFYTVPKNSENGTNNILLNNISTWGEWVAGRLNGNLYLYGRDGNNYMQGYANDVRLCKRTVSGSDNSFAAGQSTSYCTEKMDYDFLTYIQNNVNNIKYYGFGYGTDNNQKPVLCFSSDLSLNSDNGLTNFYCTFPDTSTSLGFSVGKNVTPDNAILTFNFGSSPIVSGGGNNIVIGSGGIELGSNESAINYFENRYGRNESICYAGIDNVTTNWGSSVSFQEGTGLNIFQVFSGINNMSPDLDKVYVRLNSRLINYDQWFGRSGDPLYLSNYNTGTNQVDLYYDNLTFPFANNPVAVYFLASNISLHSEYSTMGSEIVSYCNLKINNGTFDEIIDQSVKNNITKYTEQSNKNNGLNPDGTQKVFTGFMGSGFNDGISFSSGFFSGTDYEVYTGDMSDFFEDSIEQIKHLLDDGNPFTGVLPNWLIFAFLLVVLFKILRNY